ncbi:hypothetical protein T440DRAFT_90135 [Plenodomus tracheiphilus IPT5]|uniref:Uncharacterized protein n=1 Tax=Plenodomus tracheiphilus IPT5 TaxID=1408161 RepID=A0A6A7B7Z7_9PLEO|nr:hypothetical protein T440DRAFT_90135 [Plenodomus tracheiphilus IPT5]
MVISSRFGHLTALCRYTYTSVLVTPTYIYHLFLLTWELTLTLMRKGQRFALHTCVLLGIPHQDVWVFMPVLWTRCMRRKGYIMLAMMIRSNQRFCESCLMALAESLGCKL